MKGPVKNMSLRLTERFHDIRLNIPFLLRLKSTSASKRCRMTMHAQYTFEIVLIASMLDPLRNAVATNSNSTCGTCDIRVATCTLQVQQHGTRRRQESGVRYFCACQSRPLLDAGTITMLSRKSYSM